jgi:hypothetical protein
MITVKTTDIWTNDPPELILRKIKWNTHEVRFGAFNSFTRKEVNSDWIGEIDEKNVSFKLFRVTSPDHTSDFSVHGQYEIRAGRGVVKIRHKLHFTSILGPAGLLTCVYALWYLFQKKGKFVGPGYLFLALIIASSGYMFFLLRDLRKNETSIRELLERIWIDDPDDESDEAEEDEID